MHQTTLFLLLWPKPTKIACIAIFNFLRETIHSLTFSFKIKSYIIIMQANLPLSQLLLPRRSAKSPRTVSKQGKATSFSSNLFDITLKGNISSIFQFSLDITPELPPNSNALRDKIIHTIYSELKKLVWFVCSKGDMVWGRKNIAKPQVLIAEFDRAKEHFKFQVMLKPVKEITVTNFLKENPENIMAISQILNINTKNMLRKAKMTELTLGCYYDEATINNNCSKEFGLNVWRGYKATVVPYNGKIFLQVDVCSRVLREENFLMTIEQDRKSLTLQEINVKYSGSSILMKYGNLKVYRIQNIEFKMNPKCTFYYDKQGKDITYIDYFKTKYGYQIKNDKQPMVKVLAKKMKHSTLPEGRVQPEFIYIVPEMLTLTGLSDAQRSNFKIMKSLDPYTKLTPQQRMEDTRRMIEKLMIQEDLMFEVKNEPTRLEGYQLESPEIKLGGGKTIVIKNGNINLRDKVLEPHTFKNYLFCYSTGRDVGIDQDEADYAIAQLKKAAETFGIKVLEPYWAEVKNPKNFHDWKEDLDDKLKKDEKTDVIIFFLRPNEEKLYPELKKYASTVYKCPSQVIRRKNLSTNTKNVLSFASKMILQMNSKTGHPLWSVPNYHPFWKNNKIALAAIASSKGKKGTTIGFVGTTNPDLTQVICDCKKVQGKEGLSSALFQGLFTPWLQNYFMKNQKALPSTIVIYREGLNDVQARHQFEFQVQGLLETMKVVRVKTKSPDYNPRICYLLVNKRPNSRIFERDGNGKNSSYSNPTPGSVIFQDLSKDGYREFHLASVNVREEQGSCTPVQFKIGYESGEIPLDALAELTYNQCYGYYNWTGAVRVPACLQYANKFAKQCSEIGEEYALEEKGSDLKTKPYFL